MPTVSIIIPHWNGRHHLADCFQSLADQTYRDFEIVLVDNGSTDGSQQLVRDEYPHVRLVELGENRGFTGACNAGYAVAQGEIIVLLNNDTAADPAWLAELTAGFDADPQVGSVVGKILLFDQRDTVHTAGDYYRVDGLPGNRGVWQKDDGRFDQPKYVFSGCGAAVAYRRALLAEIGFLDDAFYFSCEDVDLGWRINLAGRRVLYVPTAVVYHKLKASGGTGEVAAYYDGRNCLYVIWKNYPGDLLRRHWRKIAAAQWRIMREALAHWRGAAARARLRGQLAGLLGAVKMWSRRRQIQADRAITIDELMTRLTSIDGR